MRCTCTAPGQIHDHAAYTHDHKLTLAAVVADFMRGDGDAPPQGVRAEHARRHPKYAAYISDEMIRETIVTQLKYREKK